MKSIIASAMAVVGLAAAPFAALAQNDEGEAVSYEDAMRCSALFSLIADSAEGDEADQLQDLGARWLLAAMSRDGTEDGSTAQGELEVVIQALIDALGEREEAEGEELLTSGIDMCEGKYELIAEEMDAIEFEAE